MIHVRTFFAVAALSAFVVGGCGDSSSSTRTLTGDSNNSVPPGSSSGAGRHCSMTLSGAISGTYACDLVMAVWSSESDRGAVNISSNILGTSGVRVSASAGFLGAPATKTYASTDADAKGGFSVADGQNVWAAVTGTDPQGSYTVSISSVTEAETQPTGKAYRAAGTLTATLTAAKGTAASGTVTMVAEFR